MTDMPPPAGASRDLARRFYPEIGIAGFSHVDGVLLFYSQIAALLRPEHRLLDFGAGRGGQIVDNPVPYRRALMNFQGRCAHVEGCDVDPAVLTNPFLDGAKVVTPGEPLPYPDASFDIIVSRYVFEHVDDPAWMADELLRILKPGGWIAAVTPNRYGYIALVTGLVPNRLHTALLRRIQPERKAEDVFPTRYLLNTGAALRRYFGGRADVITYTSSAEPAYHFNRAPVFAAFKLLHKLLPSILHATLFVFIRKHSR